MNTDSSCVLRINFDEKIKDYENFRDTLIILKEIYLLYFSRN